jgi:LmbE family N-acetylglucosaminyl deacetylase
VENKTIPLVLRESKVLIIAPHPDDETFACGGLIAQKKHLGVTVQVLFLSRGEGAHRNCCATSEQTIGDTRRHLAEEACSHLGLRPVDLLWCDFPDGAIPGNTDQIFTEAALRLSKIFTACMPTEIYTPHPHDCWPDHGRATELVLAAIALAKWPIEMYFYPVWMWHNLRLRDLGLLKGWQALRLDIRPVREKKQAAITQYLAATNPVCGIPYCGNLPKGFLDPFRKDHEIFFRQNEDDRL